MSLVSSFRVRTLVAAAGCALAAASVSAAPERFWTNNQGGSFTTATNWHSPSGGTPLPGAAEYAIFNIAATYTVTLPVNYTTARLGGRLGNVMFDLGGRTFDTGTFFMSDEDGVTAAMTLNTGQLNSEYGFIGQFFMTQGTLTQTGGNDWALTNDYSLGDFGTGVHTINPGSTLSTLRGLFIGTGSTGVGTLNVAGSGALASAALDMYVGYFGDGTLNVTGGGDVTTPVLAVGTSSGSTGHVLISGEGSTLGGATDIWNLGSSGDAFVTVSGGADVGSLTTQIGAATSAYGELLITGAGSTWTSNAAFYIGRTGEGKLVVENDGRLTAMTSVVLGLGATGEGDVTVRTGGQIVTDSQLQVAREGFGTMQVLAQSSVTSSGLDSPTFTAGYIGGLAGSSGMLTLDGANSRWFANGGSVVVGFGGEGTMIIQGAARVNSVGGFIGRNPDSNGSVRISGANSLWNSTGGVSVGLGPNGASGGAGLLTVNGQGRIFAPVLNVGPAGKVEGTGTVQSTVSNGGTFAPGNESTPTGQLNVTGAYSQTAGGVLEIELGASGHDVLSVSGNAHLSGALLVTLNGAFEPTSGASFEILTSGARTGTFLSVALPTLPDGAEMSVSYTSTKVILSVQGGGTPCPQDVDGDNFIGFGDLNVVLSQFNTSGQGLQGDVDDDGDVDFGDLNAIVSQFNTNCP